MIIQKLMKPRFLRRQIVNSLFTNMSRKVLDNNTGENCRKEVWKTENASSEPLKNDRPRFYCFQKPRTPKSITICHNFSVKIIHFTHEIKDNNGHKLISMLYRMYVYKLKISIRYSSSMLIQFHTVILIITEFNERGGIFLEFKCRRMEPLPLFSFASLGNFVSSHR